MPTSFCLDVGSKQIEGRHCNYSIVASSSLLLLNFSSTCYTEDGYTLCDVFREEVRIACYNDLTCDEDLPVCYHLIFCTRNYSCTWFRRQLQRVLQAICDRCDQTCFRYRNTRSLENLSIIDNHRL